MSLIYETDKVLGEYLLFHFGSDDEILPPGADWPVGMREALGFAARTPQWFSRGEVERGLDLGCAVGRSAWEMAKSCREVVGIDFSQAFIAAAEEIRAGGRVEYERLDEGRLRVSLEAAAPDGVDAGRLRFEQGDAMALRGDLGSFDRVHAANLVCRLGEPDHLLRRLPELVRGGGELVLATPCTWLEEFTPKTHWPEGKTIDWLDERLGRDFSLERTGEEPFLIRETARKFQWSRSLMSVWRRKT